MLISLSGTRELVNDTGYDSLDDTPSEHDGRKLNERDNDRELDEYPKVWQPSDVDG
jgi:hypothetical protein